MNEGLAEVVAIEAALDAPVGGGPDSARGIDTTEWPDSMVGGPGAVWYSFRLESARTEGRVMTWVRLRKPFVVYCALWAPVLIASKVIWG